MTNKKAHIDNAIKMKQLIFSIFVIKVLSHNYGGRLCGPIQGNAKKQLTQPSCVTAFVIVYFIQTWFVSIYYLFNAYSIIYNV